MTDEITNAAQAEGSVATAPAHAVSEQARSGDSGEAAENRIYEVGYLILPTVPEGDVPREITAIKDALDKEKASIISEEFPKFRPLAYPIEKRVGEGYQKYANGYFGWVKFETSAKSALRIEQEFKKNKSILRYLLIKTVREHTLTAGRPRVDRRERREAPKGAPASAPVSEAELDKSIEKLIAE
jgi:ribosomal protein S6